MEEKTPNVENTIPDDELVPTDDELVPTILALISEVTGSSPGGQEDPRDTIIWGNI